MIDSSLTSLTNDLYQKDKYIQCLSPFMLHGKHAECLGCPEHLFPLFLSLGAHLLVTPFPIGGLTLLAAVSSQLTFGTSGKLLIHGFGLEASPMVAGVVSNAAWSKANITEFVPFGDRRRNPTRQFLLQDLE